MTIYEPLKLMALDQEDLQIIIALLSDSLLPVVSIVYDANSQTLTMLANRFCWEIPEFETDGVLQSYRVHSGLLFKNVISVHEKNIGQHEKGKILSFLISKIELCDDGYMVYFMFSDDAYLRLKVSDIDCILADIDEPWVTTVIPAHVHDYAFDEHSENKHPLSS